MPNQSASWPGGRTYVFRGTVGEDATAGTHVSSLTITPGAGNEIQMLYGRIQNGNTATSQTMAAYVDDGTSQLTIYLSMADTSALVQRSFPTITALTTNVNAYAQLAPYTPGFVVSGTMRVVLQVTTTAVSVTQAFTIVLRVFGDSPTFTLADTVGTPTLTTDTSGFF